MAKAKAKFTQVDSTNVKMEYKGIKYLLNVGTYGLGKLISLNLINADLTTTFLKSIGWTKSDNHSPKVTSFLPGTSNTWESCKKGAVDYIDLMS